MFRTVVVGYDGSAQANDALALAQQLRDCDGGRLLVTAVVPLAGGVLLTSPDAHVQNLRDQAVLELAHGAERLLPDTPHELVAVGEPSPALGLRRVAEEHGADLIVLGSTHRRRASVLAGRSTVQRLMHGAPCPVAVAAPGQEQRFASKPRLCVAYDASPEARAALDAAYRIAAHRRGSVEVLRVREEVVSPYAVTPGAIAAENRRAEEHRAQADLDEALGRSPDEVVAVGRLLRGGPIEAILGAAQEADLLVAGSRGYGPLHRVLAGSTSIGLLTDGHVPILVTPRVPGGRDAAAVDRRAGARVA